MKVMVTGSTGFIGGALCRALVQRGYEVRAFHRPNSSVRLLKDLPVEHASGDLAQPSSLAAAMQGVQAVFHVAAWMGGGDPGRLYAINVEGTRAVVQAALTSAIDRLVVTSSVAALGIPPPGSILPFDEHHTWNFVPEWYPYGYAKYLAELEVQKGAAQGLDAVIVNPSLVIGAGDIYRQSSSIIQQVAERRITVSVEGGANFVHIDDVVEGHIAALLRGLKGERYILAGENLPFLEFLGMVARVTGAPAPAVNLPGGVMRALRAPASLMERFLSFPVSAELLVMAGRYLYYDTSKARRELVLPPARAVEQAVREAYAWFQPLSPQSHSSRG